MSKQKSVLVILLICAFVLELLFLGAQYLAFFVPIPVVAIVIFCKLRDENEAAAWVLALTISLLYGIFFAKNLSLVFLSLCLAELTLLLVQKFFFGRKFSEIGLILLFFNFFGLLSFWQRNLEVTSWLVIMILNFLVTLLLFVIVDRVSVAEKQRYRV